MRHSRNSGLLLASVAALFLVGCTDNDEAKEEAEAMSERTEESIERDPATSAQSPATAVQQQPQAVPAPENVSAPPEDAQKTENGVAYVVLEDQATDVGPATTDIVTVHYTGWTTDGAMFDSSVARGEPATFPLDQLIPGWQEAVPLMTVGDKYRFWIPGELAYDNSNRPGAPKGMLVFDIELIDVQPAAQEEAGETE